MKMRLHSLSRDINGAAGTLITDGEKDELLSVIDDMYEDVEKSSRSQDASGIKAYKSTRPHLGLVGSPKFNLSKEQLQFLADYKFTAPLMAETLQISESTIRRRLREYNIKLREGRTTEITDENLDEKVRAIIGTNKRIGPNSIRLRLEIENIHVQRERVRSSCHRVDPAGSSLRSIERQNIHRRTYKVAGPNSLWHVDGNHKLIRWGIVIHGGIDGYSRLVLFLHASNNNRANTVFDIFIDATKIYGIPSRIRVDCGGENTDICTFMEGYRGKDRGSAIRGKSSHNQRIERLWVDLWIAVSNEYYDLFTYMEDSNILDITSALHMWAFQLVFLPRINKSLQMFIYQYNNHGLSTEHSHTPHQLFIQGVLKNINSDNVSIKDLMFQAGSIEDVPESVATDSYGIEESNDDNDEPSDSDDNLHNINCPLDEQQLQDLRMQVDLTADLKNLPHGVELFKNVLSFIDSIAEDSSNDSISN